MSALAQGGVPRPLLGQRRHPGSPGVRHRQGQTDDIGRSGRQGKPGAKQNQSAGPIVVGVQEGRDELRLTAAPSAQACAGHVTTWELSINDQTVSRPAHTTPKQTSKKGEAKRWPLSEGGPTAKTENALAGQLYGGRDQLLR